MFFLLWEDIPRGDVANVTSTNQHQIPRFAPAELRVTPRKGTGPAARPRGNLVANITSDRESADMDEARQLEKLKSIEALHAGATTEGERAAAASAHSRILAGLHAEHAKEGDIKMAFTLHTPCGSATCSSHFVAGTTSSHIGSPGNVAQL